MKTGSLSSFQEAAELPDREDYEPEPPEAEQWIKEIFQERDALRVRAENAELRESILRQALQDFYDAWADNDGQGMNITSKRAWKALAFPGPSVTPGHFIRDTTRAAVAGALEQARGLYLIALHTGPPTDFVTIKIRWPAFVLLCADLGVGPESLRQTTSETATETEKP